MYSLHSEFYQNLVGMGFLSILWGTQDNSALGSDWCEQA